MHVWKIELIYLRVVVHLDRCFFVVSIHIPSNESNSDIDSADREASFGKARRFGLPVCTRELTLRRYDTNLTARSLPRLLEISPSVRFASHAGTGPRTVGFA